MNRPNLIWVALLIFIISSCSSSNNESVNNDEINISKVILYHNGDIITMEGDNPEYAEALVVDKDKIVFVGSEIEAKEKYMNFSKVDLKGKTLVPGFVDGHVHFSALGTQALSANLLASPDGEVNTIDDLIRVFKDWTNNNEPELFNGWYIGMGFDDAIFGKFPTKDDLDKVSKEVPVMAIHISGHFCVINTKGLEVAGITSDTENPEGGIIRRVSGTNEPNGVLEELAAIPLMGKTITPDTPEKIDKFTNAAQDLAISFGYTTAQEGRASTNHEALAKFATEGKLKIDVPSYIDYAIPKYFETDWYSTEYKNHYRIAGIKLTLDGSPQGRTAWRTEPYLIPPDGESADYNGYPAIPEDEKVQEIVNMAYKNSWQLLVHCNGDAAADQMIRAVSNAANEFGNTDRRTTLIHGQYIRYDQIDSLAKYDIIPSLFPMHTYYWGDWHRQIIGEEKGSHISPTKTALKKCGIVTSHTDAPVALPNLMMILWTTVNRQTRSGDIIGPEEALTPYEALKTITIWGAYQHFEEDTKGSLKPGKLADLVILSDNPLKVDPLSLKDILVLETIKEGNSIYKRE
ncbi:amidohydrolase [Marinigracilibium pacificum]|uniref:Amidohydrolase n=1 Tax=Marinigracilibium pacificum TaxID=2729599 RepID=A0A848J051_9BACT|nr:amidohydrolase [Marinigracilibium pacificum]NMM47854.1 amidohydrolase [Marinigracilibium pacificum]